MSGRRFESVFANDGQSPGGRPRFRIAGSGIHKPPRFAPLTGSVVEALRSQGINVIERSLGSPGNVDSYHLEASFKDGGLQASTGNYWMEKRGAWVEGEEAVCWVAQLLGLKPPGSLRRHQAPRLPTELRTAYEATDYIVHADEEIHLEVGSPPPGELLKFLTDSQASTAALVTAWNPFSRALPDPINRLRQRQLLHDLSQRGIRPVAAEGRDRSGEWPAEPSVLALGLPRQAADELLVRYQQHALVWCTLDGPIQLLEHPR